MQLQRAPNITASPVPGSERAAQRTGQQSRQLAAHQAVWDWYKQNHSANRTYYQQPGIDWAADQWGLPGVGTAKRDDLWSAGITTWDQVANPTPAEQAALLKIAENNPNTVAEWMGKAQYTLGVNAGYLPPAHRSTASQSAAAATAVLHRPAGL